MGLFGGSSKSSSSQETDITALNAQGNQAPVSGVARSNLSYAEQGGLSNNRSNVSYAEQGGLSGTRSNIGFAESGGFSVGKGRLTVNNANSTELAQIAADISLGALDYYEKQNQRSTALLEQVALATTQSNKDVINEFANITEKASQSEALTLNEQLLKYGVVSLIGFYILKGAKRA